MHYLEHLENIRLMDTHLAKKIGVNESLFICQLWYWMQRSDNVRNDRRWVYKTLKEWMAEHPYWAKNTVRRTIKNLEEAGIVLSGEFNKFKQDRTKWYTIELNHECFSTDHVPNMGMPAPAQNDQLHVPNVDKSNHKITTEEEKITEISPKAKTVDSIAAEQGLGSPSESNNYEFDEVSSLDAVTEQRENGQILSVWWRRCMRGYGHVDYTLPELTQKDQKQLKTLIKQLGPTGPVRIMLALKYWDLYKKYANAEFGLKSTVKPVIQKFVLGRNAIAGFEAPKEVDFSEKEWKTL